MEAKYARQSYGQFKNVQERFQLKILYSVHCNCYVYVVAVVDSFKYTFFSVSPQHSGVLIFFYKYSKPKQHYLQGGLKCVVVCD